MIPFHEIGQATAFDPTVYYEPRFRQRLAKKFISPRPFSRKLQYDNMAAGITSVFSNYPMNLSKKYNENTSKTLVRLLKEGLPSREKINIRTGPSRTLKRITIPDTIERWTRKRSVFGVTDLHFRGTKFYDKVDAEAVSYFNLLPHCPDEVSFLEMLTLVISSRGIFSDSHSDDGDGSNHCFVGKKLWLAWDRREGQAKGLQDCTIDPVYDQAAFDMETFISLRSSHWFIISDNRTLLMPGNFTHKVITLEPYIGYGSFYVTLPGYINTLKRWLLFETGDVKGDFISILNEHSLKKIREIAKLNKTDKAKWGLPYLKDTITNWKTGLTAGQANQLSSNPEFTRFIQQAALYA